MSTLILSQSKHNVLFLSFLKRLVSSAALYRYDKNDEKMYIIWLAKNAEVFSPTHELPHLDFGGWAE